METKRASHIITTRMNFRNVQIQNDETYVWQTADMLAEITQSVHALLSH